MMMFYEMTNLRHHGRPVKAHHKELAHGPGVM